MDLVLYRCASSEAQAPQAPHFPSTQSCGFTQSGSHRFVSTRAPAQGLPHSLFGTTITRCRSQSPVHIGLCQSLQSAKAQLRGVHPEAQDVRLQSEIRT
mmetsp:Transcript_79581/g.140772  ORF Transcript_79581/g.140772 Transcript_79581/m.140772 type:complete len:99 (+) Transcript_79581:2230-2526(+)